MSALYLYVPQISQAKDDLILFSSSPSGATPPQKAEQEAAVQQRPQTVSLKKESKESE